MKLSTSIFFFCAILVFTACDSATDTSTSENSPADTTVQTESNDEVVMAKPGTLAGLYNYQAEKYVYTGNVMDASEENFKEKVNESGTLEITEEADGSLTFKESPEQGKGATFTASSYHIVGPKVYFNIPADQQYNDTWLLDGVYLVWADVDGNKTGFAGELDLDSQEFRLQYQIRQEYEGAAGDTISEMRFQKVISNQ